MRIRGTESSSHHIRGRHVCKDLVGVVALGALDLEDLGALFHVAGSDVTFSSGAQTSQNPLRLNFEAARARALRPRPTCPASNLMSTVEPDVHLHGKMATVLPVEMPSTKPSGKVDEERSFIKDLKGTSYSQAGNALSGVFTCANA